MHVKSSFEPFFSSTEGRSRNTDGILMVSHSGVPSLHFIPKAVPTSRLDPFEFTTMIAAAPAF
jgi:hypothetical protein